MTVHDFSNMKRTDPEVAKLISSELVRREKGLEMIPSENLTSLSVLEALGSVMTDKYSEGYPGKRYYGGNEFVDQIEQLAIDRAKKAFGVPFANVQPYSGSPANFEVYMSVCKPGDTIMGQNLSDGGHLTHGWKTSATGMYFKSVPYHLGKDGRIDIEEARRLAMEHRPKLIWVGSTAYVHEFPFEDFGKIADECGAYLAADISHISGLVIAGVHPSPSEHVHIITTTTHKTLRGPRGAIIMVTEKGLRKDPELAEKINKPVFPGLQGGPHNNTTAGIAVALGEALRPEFKEYGKQILKNSEALAAELMRNGIDVVSGTTRNHMILVDLRKFGMSKGVFVQDALDLAGITVNKNTVPGDTASPFYPSGIRIGVPAITTRGMKEAEMEIIGSWMAEIIDAVKHYELPDDKESRTAYLKSFREEIKADETIRRIGKEVEALCARFPMYRSR